MTRHSIDTGYSGEGIEEPQDDLPSSSYVYELKIMPLALDMYAIIIRDGETIGQIAVENHEEFEWLKNLLHLKQRPKSS